MCESCQKGRLQVGKLGCCTFKKWRQFTCSFYVFTKNEFEFGISRFDHFTTTSLVCYRFFYRQKNLITSKVRENIAFTIRKIWLLYVQNMAFLHILRTWSTCWTLIFRCSFYPVKKLTIYKYFYCIMIKLKKKCLYLLLNCIEFNWPNAKIPNNS